MSTTEYTVIALYADEGEGHQRYATRVTANSPDEAEKFAREQANEDNGAEVDLLIAGVIKGAHFTVDAKFYGEE